VPIVEQTATRPHGGLPHGGLPHGGLLVDRRLDAGEAVLGFLPPQRVLPAALLAPTRHAGAREALLHALVGKNHGCTHMIVGGHDREPLASLPAEELGVGLITRRL
jgi:hypothetical protein